MNYPGVKFLVVVFLFFCLFFGFCFCFCFLFFVFFVLHVWYMSVCLCVHGELDYFFILGTHTNVRCCLMQRNSLSPSAMRFVSFPITTVDEFKAALQLTLGAYI